VSATPDRSVPVRFSPTRSPFSWLLQREVVRYLRIWHYSIAGQVISPVMLLLVFGFALSDKVTVAGGVPYRQFIMPGLIAQTLMLCGYINGTTSLFDARRDHYINDVLASPLRWWEINLACVLAAVIRGIITGGIVAAIGLAIIGGSVQRPLILVVGTTAILLVSGQAGVIAGVYVKTMDQNIFLQTLVVQPLTFLGGTFYEVSTLPPAWAALTHVNPVFYAVQALRISFLGSGEIPAGTDLAVLWGMALLLSAWSLLLFRSGRRLKD
jgi:ABC-2 type transport system permease protein